MPGISFVYAFGQSLHQENGRILSSLDSLLHSPSYKREILLSTPSYLLACTKYEEYPICSFETEHFYICLEGQIYGRGVPELRTELNYVATLVFDDTSKTDGCLNRWLLETNGEFVLFVIKKDSNEIAILSDALGHLPLYYCKVGGVFLLSREMRFIRKLLDNFKIDKVALSQYLLFCYSLGQRSFLENVFRLGANGFIRIDLNSGEISIRNLFEFNFEQKEYANRTLQNNARNLIEILTDGCKAVRRSSEGSVNVLALSGGLDSRIVMLAMGMAAIPFSAATRLADGNASARDVDVARKLARVYKLDWRLFELQPTKFSDALRLLYMKNGLNYLGMSFILSFLRRVQECYGQRTIYWTGDTGLVVRRESPVEILRSYDDLIDIIVREHQIFDIRDIAGLLQTDTKTIREEIRNVLEAYPERSLEQKYVHFVMRGRTMNWHYEGMDRNRCYFWLSAPLEFTTFFDYAMNCPETQKTNYRLYRAILGQMSPESCRVIYAGHGIAPGSFVFPIMLKARSVVQKMPPSVRRRLKNLLRQKREDVSGTSLITECIKQQVNNCSALREYFSNKYAESLLQRTTALQNNVLLTVTSAIEELTTSKSSFEDYQEEDFA